MQKENEEKMCLESKRKNGQNVNQTACRKIWAKTQTLCCMSIHDEPLRTLNPFRHGHNFNYYHFQRHGTNTITTDRSTK